MLVNIVFSWEPIQKDILLWEQRTYLPFIFLISENVALEDPRSIPSPSQQQGSSSSNVPVWSNRNPRNIYANPVPNYCWTHYHVDFPPTRYEDVDQTPVRIENLPSRGSFRKNPAHQVHVPDRLRLRLEYTELWCS